jgi:hypothetical protein
MKNIKNFIKWLFSFKTIAACLLGASIGLHINQHNRNDLQMKVNRRFDRDFETVADFFHVSNQVDSMQVERINENSDAIILIFNQVGDDQRKK